MILVDKYGIREIRPDTNGLSEMRCPVMCKWCREIHDAGKVEVVQRYMDCSVWKCPNCHQTLDDRPEKLGGSAIPVDIDHIKERIFV